MTSCQDFNQLFELCSELIDMIPPLKKRVPAFYCLNIDRIDNIAQNDIPADGPRNLIAVLTDRDGNCLGRSVSKSFFNVDKHHLELRADMIIEGIVNKDRYLDDNHLEMGATFIHANADLPTVFVPSRTFTL